MQTDKLSNKKEPSNGILGAVVGSALLPQYCKDCNNHPCDNHDKHIKCKKCYFIGNQQSNFERKSV